MVKQTANASTNWPIGPIIADNDSGTSAGYLIYTNGHTQNNWGDIRFADASANVFGYWEANDTGWNSTCAIFYINVTGNVSAGDQTVYAYYGNTTAAAGVTAENIANVAFFYDEFVTSENLANKWYCEAGSWSCVNGALNSSGTGTIHVVSGTYDNVSILTRICEGNTIYEAPTWYMGNGTRGLAGVDSHMEMFPEINKVSALNRYYHGTYTNLAHGANVTSNNPPSQTVGWNVWQINVFSGNATSFINFNVTADCSIYDATDHINYTGFYTSGSYCAADWYAILNITQVPPVLASWTSEAQSPTVALNTPVTNAGSYPTVNFTYIPSLYAQPAYNSTLYIYNSTTQAIFAQVANSTPITDAVANGISYTFTVNGTYLWNVAVNISYDVFYASSNFTINAFVNGQNQYPNNYNTKIDLASDVGTHSNFTAQQSAPDGIYDNLTSSQNFGGSNSIAYCNAASGTGWNSAGYSYDNNTGTAASYAGSTSTWTNVFLMNFSVPVAGNTIQYNIGNVSLYTTMNVSLANATGSWTPVYSNIPTYDNAWHNITFAQSNFTAMNFTFYSGGIQQLFIYEMLAYGDAYYNAQLQEQFMFTNYTAPIRELDVYMGSFSNAYANDTLGVRAYLNASSDGSPLQWVTIISVLQANAWNNISILNGSSGIFFYGTPSTTLQNFTIEFYCYNSGTICSSWNVDSVVLVTASWPTTPIAASHSLGFSEGIGNGFYYNGTHSVVYFVYQNSSDISGGPTTWMYWISCYDINASTWYSVNTGIGSPQDGHYAPTISALPNGSLIIMYAYASDLQYWTSVNEANSTVSTLTLISNWNPENGANGGVGFNTLSYIQPIWFSDRLVVTMRYGGASGGYQVETTLTTGNFGSWTQITNWTSNIELYTSIYWAANVQRSTGIIAMAARGYNETTMGNNASGNTNCFFCYSDDKGVTWRFANGTSFTLPIEGQLLQVANLSANVFVESPVWDENGTMVIPYDRYANGTIYTGIIGNAFADGMLVYSNALGTVGTWSDYNATDATTGNQIVGFHQDTFSQTFSFDSKYDALAFWTAYGGSEYYYIREPYSPNLFYPVINDSSQNYQFTYNSNVGSSVTIPPPAYQNILAQYILLVGNATTASCTNIDTSNYYEFWGTLYTAPVNGTVTVGDVYTNCSGHQLGAYYNMAIYYANNTGAYSSLNWTLVNNGTAAPTSNAYSQPFSWVLPLGFPNDVRVYGGVKYYVCARFYGLVPSHAYPNLIYAASSDSQQSFNFSYNDGAVDGNWPSTLNSSMTFWGRSLCIAIYSTLWTTKGWGVMDFSNIFTNNTKPSAGDVVSFTFTVADDNGLSSANFTGSWSNANSTAILTISNTVATATFNVTMPTPVRATLLETGDIQDA
ncbi:MAG: DUF2341 domain-containing protein [Candidatus Bathyarchaeia archaeon]